jgi:hypothetical protein
MARFTQPALWCCAIIFSGRLLATTMESGNVSSNALLATGKHSARQLQLGFKIESSKMADGRISKNKNTINAHR